MNMGILTMFIEKRIHPKSEGKFELFYGSEGDFEAFASKQLKTNQPIFKEGFLYSGFLPLVESTKKSKFGAYISLWVAR